MGADELKRRREALGLSTYELAYLFEVAPSSIYRWESGATPLVGLMAVGADTVLREAERKRRTEQRHAEPQGGEG